MKSSCRFLAVGVGCLVAAFTLRVSMAGTLPFTVPDEIGMAYFGDPNTSEAEAITLSPDGLKAAVHVVRGDLEHNRVRDEVRIYDLRTVKRWVADDSATPPGPQMVIRLATYKEGPVITHLRWLRGSGGIAFLARTENGHEQLWLADLALHSMRPLTPADQSVSLFDIADARHYIYAVSTPSRSVHALATATSFRVEDRGLQPVLDPEDLEPMDRSILWAVQDGQRHPLVNPATGVPIVVYLDLMGFTVRISPDGRTAVAALPLVNVPEQWSHTYASPSGEHPMAGPQDLSVSYPWSLVTQYATVDLKTGSTTALLESPAGLALGWQGPGTGVSWSGDGRAILVPDAVIPGSSSGSCVAVIDVARHSASCVLSPERNIWVDFVSRLGFRDGEASIVEIEHCRTRGSECPVRLATYHRTSGGKWLKQGERPVASDSGTSLRAGVSLEVRQGLNDSPVLWATAGGMQRARALWDPNPQLKLLRFGPTSLYHWTDGSGKSWTGGLYLPPDYRSDSRYPLVVQTHGFFAEQFRPSGMYTEGYAARELAAAGIAVLDVPDCKNAYSGDAGEATCAETLYQGAVNQLVHDGIVDPGRVGITGFSRSCFYVLDLLTKRTFPIRAAMIIDGVNFGYLQYLASVRGSGGGFEAYLMEKAIGAAPWGAGLRTWLQRSPEFNLDKVRAPLEVIAAQPGPAGLSMWEPYAILKAMNKPVDMLVLRTTAHPTWQPAARLASQQGAVDWYRFWLQGYEDPDPAKAALYQSWRKLRELDDVQRKGNLL